MNAYDEGRSVEAAGLIDILPYAKCVAEGAQVVLVDGHEGLQRWKGDFLYQCRRRGARSVELKCEQENKYGNLFIETWSNRHDYRRGWFDYCGADELWYYFVTNKQLYRCSLLELKQWAKAQQFDGRPRLHCFPEKQQGKYTQNNDTWGHCVPIRILLDECPTFEGPVDPTSDEAKQTRLW